MSLSFRSFAVAVALVCFVLSLTWLLAPNLLLAMWGVEYSYSVALVARRSAALFLGIGAMFFLARNAGPSQSRLALLVGFAIGCFSLASLGIFELVSGHAGFGILLAVSVEFVLGIGSLAAARDEVTSGPN